MPQSSVFPGLQGNQVMTAGQMTTQGREKAATGDRGESNQY